MESVIYRYRVGSLMYLVKARPNMCYEINHLSEAMVRATKMHWKLIKHVSRDLRGTTQYGLWYIWIEGVKLQGFTDEEWVGSTSNRKSISGGIFSIGLAIVSWYNRK